MEWPPAIRSKPSGGSTSPAFASNHASTRGRSIPSGTSPPAPTDGASLACSLTRTEHMPEDFEENQPPGARALIVDFGGVLTTSVWPAFAAFCEREGLATETVRELFRGDAEALKLLRGLETGELADAEFERALRRPARARRSRAT